VRLEFGHFQSVFVVHFVGYFVEDGLAPEKLQVYGKRCGFIKGLDVQGAKASGKKMLDRIAAMLARLEQAAK